MPVIRLTDEQRDEAGDRFDQAKRMAKRFKAPPGYSAEEWEAECLLVLVEAVATVDKNSNFEAHLYMRCRFRRLQLLKKHRPVGTLVVDLPARAEKHGSLDEVLEGVDPKDSDLLMLKTLGADWETLGTAYGCSGRTVRRWYRRVVERLRRRESKA